MLRSFLRSVKGAGAPFIDPLSEPGLELYLRSDQTPAVNNGDPVLQCLDLSGNGRTHFRGTVAANTPTLVTNATGSGKSLIRFDGAPDPNGDFMECFIAPVGAWPSNGEGYTFYLFGKVYVLVNFNGQGNIWSDVTNGRPQLISREFATNRIGWRDTLSTVTGGSTEDSGVMTHLEWVFPASGFVNRPAEVYKRGVLQVTGTWGWNSASAGPTDTLGISPLVTAVKFDLGAFLWYSRSHPYVTRLGIRNWFATYFGGLEG